MKISYKCYVHNNCHNRYIIYLQINNLSFHNKLRSKMSGYSLNVSFVVILSPNVRFFWDRAFFWLKFFIQKVSFATELPKIWSISDQKPVLRYIWMIYLEILIVSKQFDNCFINLRTLGLIKSIWVIEICRL